MLESVRLAEADADVSLLWLLLSPADGAGAVALEFGLARMTSLCPADVRCDADNGAPVLTGIPSNCCLLVTATSASESVMGY